MTLVMLFAGSQSSSEDAHSAGQQMPVFATGNDHFDLMTSSHAVIETNSLSQDMVVEFAKLDSYRLLEETERAVCLHSLQVSTAIARLHYGLPFTRLAQVTFSSCISNLRISRRTKKECRLALCVPLCVVHVIMLVFCVDGWAKGDGLAVFVVFNHLFIVD